MGASLLALAKSIYYKGRLYNFREFTDLHCKVVMPPQNSNQDLNRDSNCLFLTKRSKTFC